MTKAKKGFEVGSIVVCIKEHWRNGQRVTTIGKEYVVSFWSKNQVLIKEDTVGLKMLLPFSNFLPKNEYLQLQREKKINQIINKDEV